MTVGRAGGNEFAEQLSRHDHFGGFAHQAGLQGPDATTCSATMPTITALRLAPGGAERSGCDIK